MKYFISNLILALHLLFLALPARSQIVVYDPASIQQLIQQYALTIEGIQHQVTQIGQLDQAIELSFQNIEAITGSKGYTGLLNSPTYRAFRRQLPFDSRVVLDGLAHGQLPSNKDQLKAGLSGLIDFYRFSVMAEDLETQEERDALVDRYEDLSRNSALMANATAGNALSNTEENIIQIEGLIDEIDSTIDLKSSMDLSARIQAQNALLLNNLINLEASELEHQTTKDITRTKTGEVDHWERGF